MKNQGRNLFDFKIQVSHSFDKTDLSAGPSAMNPANMLFYVFVGLTWSEALT
jgi:hypothetical protein